VQSQGVARDSPNTAAAYLGGADRWVLLLGSQDASVPFLVTLVSSQMMAASTESSWASFLSAIPVRSGRSELCWGVWAAGEGADSP